MASAKPKPPDDKAQTERFLQTAKELGVDESGRAFVRALKKIVPKKRARRV